MTRKLTYLATPYTHPDIVIRSRRYHIVTRVAAELMNQGELIYSPISHTHEMATLWSLPTEWSFWESHCRAFLNASHKLIVLQQEGWQESVGVQAEIATACELELPVEYMEVMW